MLKTSITIVIAFFTVTVTACADVASMRAPGASTLRDHGAVYADGHIRTFDTYEERDAFVDSLSDPLISARGLRVRYVRPILADYVVNNHRIHSSLEFSVWVDVPESAAHGDYRYHVLYNDLAGKPLVRFGGVVRVRDDATIKREIRRNRWVLAAAVPGVLLLLACLMAIDSALGSRKVRRTMLRPHLRAPARDAAEHHE